MRVVVMGSGGIGGLCGARLAAVGADVMFIARGEHLQSMQTSGLQLKSSQGDVILDKVAAVDDPRGKPTADIVLFTVKGPDTERAIDLISPIVAPETGIITFQNGVEGIDKLAARFGQGAVMPGVAFTTAFVSRPGLIQHVGQTLGFSFGEWNGAKSARAAAYQEIAQNAGLNTRIAEKPLADVWYKYVGTAGSFAAINLSRLPMRTVVERPETCELTVQACNEIMALARARGIDLPPDSIDKLIAFARTVDPSWKGSMLTDLEAGKVIEVEAMFGSAHRMGLALGVPTPVISVAYRALKAYGEPR